MKVNCSKCGKHIANVVEPSTIKKGATLYGACYECKMETLHNGGKDDFGKQFMDLLKGFGK